jgi:ElaB/YqjD/DUF883 family membrane-anchored ribosome-binding protein
VLRCLIINKPILLNFKEIEMESSKLNNDFSSRETTNSNLADSASELLNEGKKYANELYQQGVDKVSEADDMMKEYSDKIAQKIHEKPITAVLIAAGVGMLLASLLRK